MIGGGEAGGERAFMRRGAAVFARAGEKPAFATAFASAKTEKNLRGFAMP